MKTKRCTPKDQTIKIYSNKTYISKEIELKCMHLNHDFYVVVGKQCRT